MKPAFSSFHCYLLIFFLSIGYGCKTNSEANEKPEKPLHSISHPIWLKNAFACEIEFDHLKASPNFLGFEEFLTIYDSLGYNMLIFQGLQQAQVVSVDPQTKFKAIDRFDLQDSPLGKQEDFKALVNTAHTKKQKVILAWNGLSISSTHPWYDNYPEWISIDTVDVDSQVSIGRLDYSSNGMRQAMIGQMRWWIDSMDIDGFYIQQFQDIPQDFLMAAHRELDQQKDIILIGDTEQPEDHEILDISYSHQVHSLIESIINQSGEIPKLMTFLQDRKARFHEDAIALFRIPPLFKDPAFELLEESTVRKANAFAILSSTLGGIPLMINGQEKGNEEFLKKLVSLKEKEGIFNPGSWGGEIEFIPSNKPRHILAFSLHRGQDEGLIVFNLSEEEIEFEFDEHSPKGIYRDIFNQQNVDIDHGQIHYLQAWDYVVLLK